MWRLENLSFMTTQHELLSALALDARHYLEVGVQEGKSLEVVLRNRSALQTVTLCDTWGSESGGSGRGSHDHILNDPFFKSHKDNFAFLDGDSRVLLPMLLPECSRRFDLVHIDGGHSYDVASCDLQNGWQLCGGVMVVHDICMTEVWRAFYNFCQVTDDIHQMYVFFGGHGTAVMERSL